MTHLPVEWALIACQDLTEIIEYIARDDPGAAARVLDTLEARAASLRTLAARGRIVPELKRIQVHAYRELLGGPYRLIYRVESARVVVVGVFDGRRNLEDILIDRLLRDR
ncbi:MAG: type II toxin-antitoxin system RelE/ParE family toxin [Thermoanaerobaculia bacterium]|nr:type II toxin-antitoxin system RelE/ParE family toxin [Thermoanaerobaculia bacterium]